MKLVQCGADDAVADGRQPSYSTLGLLIHVETQHLDE